MLVILTSRKMYVLFVAKHTCKIRHRNQSSLEFWPDFGVLQATTVTRLFLRYQMLLWYGHFVSASVSDSVLLQAQQTLVRQAETRPSWRYHCIRVVRN